MNVFISHSRENSSAALRLCEELGKHRVDTWLDVRDLEPGAAWDRAVRSAILSAGGFVFVIGPPGPGERSQNFEWQQIVSHEYHLDATKPLVPVLIGSPELPGFLRTRQALILENTSGSFEQVAVSVVRMLADPTASIDTEKLELGRKARRQALESFREYSQALAKEDVRRVAIRALN